jgi:hypothetical protein
VPLARHNVRDIAHNDLAFFLLCRNDSSAARDHQNLITVMGVPAGGSSGAEIHNVAAKIA